MLFRNDTPKLHKQLAFTKYSRKKCTVAWISSFPRLHFDYVEVEFNEMFYKALVEVIDEFWFDCVICGIPPKEMDAEDAGLKSPQAESGQVVEADHDTVFAYESLKVLMGQIKAMEENKANLETYTQVC